MERPQRSAERPDATSAPDTMALDIRMLVRKLADIDSEDCYSTQIYDETYEEVDIRGL